MGLFDQPDTSNWVDFPSLGSEFALGAYAEAYWDAARMLVERGGTFTSYSPPNYKAFPVAFLYRHALELALKSLLIEYWHATGYQIRDVLNRNHRLGDLIPYLRDLKEAFEWEFESENEMSFSDLEGLLGEWEKYDKNSEMFRYAVRKDLTSTLPRDDFVLDVALFAEKMDAAIGYLLDVSRAILNRIVRNEVGNDADTG